MNRISVLEKPPTRKTSCSDEIFLGDLLDQHEREVASIKEDKGWYKWLYEVAFAELARLRQKHERLIDAHRDARYEIDVLKGLRDGD